MSNSPPQLDEYNISDRRSYFSDLLNEHEDIRSEFRHLVCKLFCSFHDDEVPRLRIIFRQYLCDDYKYTDDAIKNIKLNLKQAKTVDEIHDAVFDYYSCCNFDLIEVVIKELGSKEDEANLKAYKEKFQKFSFILYNNRLKCGSHNGRNVVTIKLDIENCRRISGKTVSEAKRVACDTLHLDKIKFDLHMIRKGCLEFDFFVPDSVCKRIIEMKSEEKVKLFRNKVLSIEVNCPSIKVNYHDIYVR